MHIFQGERGESAVRFINSTLEFDDEKYARSIIKECEGNWQLNHKVPKIKFCDGTIYTEVF